MNKSEFILKLSEALDFLPRAEAEARIEFYVEAINDRVDDGMSECDAVAQIGSVDSIVSQIIADTPISSLIKKRIKPQRKLSPFTIVLLALGSPIWLSFIISAFTVFISIYLSAWAVIVSLWAVFASLAVSSFAGLAGGVTLSISHGASGLALIGASLMLAGITVFSFFGCREATRAIISLTKICLLGIKRLFVKKETAQ